MGWSVFYKDPKKKRLQAVELAVLVMLLPVALVWGSHSYANWKAFNKAEAIYLTAEKNLHAGNYPLACQGFQETLAIYPEFYGAWEGLALAYHSTRQFEKELETYKAAVAVLPQRGELHRELGTAFHRAGDHRSELKHLTIASSLLGDKDGLTVHLLERAEREARGVVQAGPEPGHDPHPMH